MPRESTAAGENKMLAVLMVVMGIMPMPIRLASLMSAKILLTLALLVNYADCAGTVVQV